MSLKEEIEKLISREQARIEARSEEHADFHERQRNRFRPLRTVLLEIADSIGEDFLESHMEEGRARIEIGRLKCSHRSRDIHWEIQPDFEIRFGSDSAKSLFYEKPGFRVEETNYYMEDISEKTLKFSEQEELIQYLLEQITKQVAQYRHLESLARKKKRAEE